MMSESSSFFLYWYLSLCFSSVPILAIIVVAAHHPCREYVQVFLGILLLEFCYFNLQFGHLVHECTALLLVHLLMLPYADFLACVALKLELLVL